ncbi:MAG: hypothetical protein HYS05_20505 [Acidobacteria bacterium]|nr:hypothetical protein [Acidobacteriota bacterium]
MSSDRNASPPGVFLCASSMNLRNSMLRGSSVTVNFEAMYGSLAVNASLSVSPYSKWTMARCALDGTKPSRRVPSLPKWPPKLMCWKMTDRLASPSTGIQAVCADARAAPVRHTTAARNTSGGRRARGLLKAS